MEPHLAVLEFEQGTFLSIILVVQSLELDTSPPGRRIMLDFEPVDETIRIQKHLDLEDLKRSCLPAGQRAGGKRIGIGEPGASVEKPA